MHLHHGANWIRLIIGESKYPKSANQILDPPSQLSWDVTFRVYLQTFKTISIVQETCIILHLPMIGMGKTSGIFCGKQQFLESRHVEDACRFTLIEVQFWLHIVYFLMHIDVIMNGCLMRWDWWLRESLIWDSFHWSVESIILANHQMFTGLGVIYGWWGSLCLRVQGTYKCGRLWWILPASYATWCFCCIQFDTLASQIYWSYQPIVVDIFPDLIRIVKVNI